MAATPETHVVEFHITNEMTEPAVRAFLASRALNPPVSSGCRLAGFVTSAALAVGGLVYWAALGFTCLTPAVLLWAAILILALVTEGRFHRRLRTEFTEHVRQIGGARVRWTLRDEGMAAESPLGPRLLPWGEVRNLFQVLVSG